MPTSSRRPDKGSPSRDSVVVTEVERKYDVPEGFRLPELSGFPKVAEVAAPREHSLDATYFDTPDLRLLRNKITLRRRTGGEDAGWHLKLPRTGDARDEVRVPLGRTTKTVPPALQTRVSVHVRGGQLGPVVRLTTSRVIHHLLGGDGTVLAEIAQDDVTAAVPSPTGRTTTVDRWSELEVELVGGKPGLLDAVEERIVAAGATRSRSKSKLARALGDRVVPVGEERPAGVRKGTAGAVLLDHLTEHVTRLKTNDPLVRADAPDAVHQMRVATRRLRSALATFRPLLDRKVTDPVRDELQWLGGALGSARDAEVIRDHLRGLVEAQPPELVHGPVVQRIVSSMDARYRAAHDEALTDLDSPRYFALLDALDALLAEPPLTPAAAGKADDVVLPLVAKTFKRIRGLVDAAEAEADPHRHDELLHEVRKAAKRARYAGEAVVGCYGRPAKIWAGRMEGIQEALGEHQDTVVIRAEIVALAREAEEAGESTFTYGRLHGLEEKRAADTEDLFEHAWAAATDKTIHRWLRR